jgi:hypothetical protein
VRVATCLPVLALALIGSCAHLARGDGAEGARKAADLFHHRVRWKDYGGAAHLLAPELRQRFEKARRTLGDERDLSISDYQLDEIEVAPDVSTAKVASKISWNRLPSLSQHEDSVLTELALRDGAWLIVRQTGGPFDGELTEEGELQNP